MDRPPPPLCLYHSNCLDGWASAAVVKRRWPTAECRPCQHSTRPPRVLGREVYLVDFGFDRTVMEDLRRQATSLTWIDHHRTHLATWQALGWGVFDLDECGATLTWRHLFADEPMPTVLAHIHDKDLWRWRLPDSRAITAALEDRFSNQDFDDLLTVDLERMAQRGTGLLRKIAKRVDRIVRRGQICDQPYGLQGARALVVNSAVHLSEVGERAYTPVADGGLGLDLAIMFYMRADGRWVHSLRAHDVDCERIAAHRGGGGHRQAASYVADRPFPLSVDCLDWALGADQG